MPRVYVRRPLIERFAEKVDRRGPDECWPWLGSPNGNGYGQLWDPETRRPVAAHRLAWQFSNNAEVPAGLFVLHTCDNPPCCNPRHLYVGTLVDNARDMVERGRQYLPRLRGEQHPAARLTNTQAAACHRAVLVEGRTQRSVAAEFGVTQQTISRIVTGRRHA